MKRNILIFCLLVCTLTARAQNHDIAVADIDLDGVADTLSIDRQAGAIVSRLSSQKFKPRTTRRIESLSNDDYEFIGLTALPGTFQLLFLADNSSCFFSFIYDQRRKKIYLDEYYAESPGGEMGKGAYEFNHILRRSCVKYWVRYYTGPTDVEHYDQTAFHTERADKRVRRLRIRFEKFSDARYYRRMKYILKDIPSK